VSGFDGKAYQARLDAMEAEGLDIHGEARFVLDLGPTAVLDAGCGTGRVAISLAERGVDVVGVDVDASMLAEARRLAPSISWIEADLATLDLGRTFPVVLLAGNVPLFCPPRNREALVSSCASHVEVGGAMIVAFSLGRDYSLAEFDAAWSKAGLELEQRWSTWELEEFTPESTYALSLLRRPS
jgi:SAM-dependent methyltransferase